jgi:hypothetical protein
MQFFKWFSRGAIALGMLHFLALPLQAQTPIRNGVVLYNQMRALEQQQANRVVSSGVLADLETDPNFVGDFQLIFDTAASILDGYVIVERGGFFPENAGIPREQQLTRSEAIYYVFMLENENELVLYRSPLNNTSEYFIRTTGVAPLVTPL